MTVSGGRSFRLSTGLVFLVLAVISFAVLLWLAHDMTFRFDDWDFIGNRSLGDPIGLLRPYNEQWVLVPAVIFRLIFALVGMHSYLPYLVVLLLFHLLVAARVRAIVRHTSGAAVGTAAGTIVLFLGTGNENLGQAFQIGMVLATLCGLWALEALVIRDRPGQASLLLLVALASHAVAAAFLGACIVVAVTRSRLALGWIALPALAVAAWLVVFDLPSMSARTGSFATALIAVPSFVAAGAATAAGAVFGLTTVAGASILVALGLVAWRFARRPHHRSLAAAALVALALEYGLIAISRAEFGTDSVLWSRYLYVAVPLVLVAVFAWFGSMPEVAIGRDRRTAIAATAIVGVAILGNLRVYLVARDLTLEVVHETRAAAAIVEWDPDLHAWNQELHLPAPDALRALLAANGTPARDDLVPGIVSAVPDTTAMEMCNQLVADRGRVAECIAAVKSRVGSR